MYQILQGLILRRFASYREKPNFYFWHREIFFIPKFYSWNRDFFFPCQTFISGMGKFSVVPCLRNPEASERDNKNYAATMSGKLVPGNRYCEVDTLKVYEHAKRHSQFVCENHHFKSKGGGVQVQSKPCMYVQSQRSTMRRLE